jgi:transcriptional regulator with XRE-family HTH domain
LQPIRRKYIPKSENIRSGPDTDPDYTALGHLFRERRESQNLSQAELSRRIDMGLDYLRGIEAGTRARPGMNSIAKIAAELGITPDEVFSVAKLPVATALFETEELAQLWVQLSARDRSILIGLAQEFIRKTH